MADAHWHTCLVWRSAAAYRSRWLKCGRCRNNAHKFSFSCSSFSFSLSLWPIVSLSHPLSPSPSLSLRRLIDTHRRSATLHHCASKVREEAAAALLRVATSCVTPAPRSSTVEGRRTRERVCLSEEEREREREEEGAERSRVRGRERERE